MQTVDKWNRQKVRQVILFFLTIDIQGGCRTRTAPSPLMQANGGVLWHNSIAEGT